MIQKVEPSNIEPIPQPFRQILEASSEVIFLLDLQGNYQYINQSIIGLNKDDILGKNFITFLTPPEKQSIPQKALEQVTKTLNTFEYNVQNPFNQTESLSNENEFNFRINPYIENKTLKGFIVYVQEITNSNDTLLLQEFQQKLKEQAQLLNYTQDAIIVQNLKGKITFWNQGAENLLNWSFSEVLLKSFIYLTASEHFSPEEEDFHFYQFAAINDILMTQDEWQGELRIYNRNNNEIFVKSHYKLVRNEDGHPTSILSFHTNITTQKRLQRQMHNIQQMKNLGLISLKLSHDLKNIYSPIIMATFLLKTRLKNDSEAQEHIDQINHCIGEASNLLDKLQILTKDIHLKKSKIDPILFISKLVIMIEKSLPKNVFINIQPENPIATISGDNIYLQQALTHILNNCSDALPHGGKIYIKINTKSFNLEQASQHDEAQARSYIVFQIQDNGVGISKENMDNIFDPFFTTQKSGLGRGFGLSITLRIIKRHGGFMEVTSQKNIGTLVKIFLPTIEKVPQVSSKGQES